MSKRPDTVVYYCNDPDHGVLLVCQLDYYYEAGDPGCWRTKNGDGWPASGPEIEINSCRILEFFLIDDDGLQIEQPLDGPSSEEWARRVMKWIDSGRISDEVNNLCIEDYGEKVEELKAVAAEERYERRREEKLEKEQYPLD